MREKLGMAAFVVLLVAVWGGGFLWFRGDIGPSSSKDPQAKGTAAPSASAQPSPSPSAAPEGGAEYTGTVTRREERQPVDVNPVAARPRPIALPPVVDFKMATFNLLGSSHTNKGGHHHWLASGPQRIPGALQILDQHQVTVAGLQEFQPDQRAAFNRIATGWEMYPGLTMDRRAGENSMAWRTDTWEMVKPGLVPIPYFNGNIRPMPYVLLRHKQTGVLAYFSTFHNPANTRQFRNQQRFRDAATSRQIDLFNQLEATGTPQFVTGDMNEREEYFCRVTGATPLIAANGGSNDGGCVVPKPTQIDWIFGSPNALFSNYFVDRSPLVRRTTDHPVVVTAVSIDTMKFKKGFDPSYTPTG